MNKEILTVVDVVSNEKGVAKEIIFDALEAALASATKKRFEGDIDCRVAIDRGTGDYQAYRRWEVVDPDARPALNPLDEDHAEALAAEEKIADGELPYPERQIWLTDATARDAALKGGDFIEEPLEAAEFGRIANEAGALWRGLDEAHGGQQVRLVAHRAEHDALVAGEFGAFQFDGAGAQSVCAVDADQRLCRAGQIA